MVKNIIIFILLLLLIITICSYYYVSCNVIAFKKDRMEFINNKEIEIEKKEKQLLITQQCNQELIKYKKIINDINNLIFNLK
jgi:cell division protein YceG involved in septum cleavage